MAIQPSSTAPVGRTSTIVKSYLVPPLAIPVAIVVTVLLFMLIHGPVP